MKLPGSADKGRPQQALSVAGVNGSVSRWMGGFFCYFERALEKRVPCLLTVAIMSGKN